MLRRLLRIRRREKLTAIRSILRRFPQRRFVLVGDSGERDPEIYGQLARRHSHQVRGVYIRHLRQNPLSDERWRKSLQGIPCCQTFTEAAELPASLGLG
jgi:phosphatidate phosphatase APP1